MRGIHILAEPDAVGKGSLVFTRATRRQFEQWILPHLPAAYNLARWLIRQEQDAEDVAQEAILRAYTFFDTFRGGDSRAWLLTIVRRTCYTWLRRYQAQALSVEAFDEDLHRGTGETMNPETLLLSHGQQQLLQHALSALPVEFREVIVLRELEELSYKEIAAITALPLGTVMSRLARARARLQEYVATHHQTEATRGL